MFGASTNDGFYDLGLKTARIIHEALDTAKIVEDREAKPSPENVAIEEPIAEDKIEAPEAPL